MSLPLFHVDAFTDRPFSGNPAAVCLLPSWKEDRWLQAVGREMNLSETAFLVQDADGFHLRWFTPKAEVDLCGHATLASAHVLWQQNLANPTEVIRFSTKSGLLKAVRTGDAIELDFPLEPDEPADPPANLLPALGVSARYVGKNRFDYVVEVESEQVLRQVAPDFKLLGMIPGRGVIVTSRSADPQFDFVSRAFFPGWALTKTRCADRPIVASALSGNGAWARTTSWRIRRRPGAAWSGCESQRIGPSWAARP